MDVPDSFSNIVHEGDPGESTSGVYIPVEMREDPASPREANKGKVPLTPMTPLVASSTIVNLLLATGPFR